MSLIESEIRDALKKQNDITFSSEALKVEMEINRQFMELQKSRNNNELTDEEVLVQIGILLERHKLVQEIYDNSRMHFCIDGKKVIKDMGSAKLHKALKDFARQLNANITDGI